MKFALHTSILLLYYAIAVLAKGGGGGGRGGGGGGARTGGSGGSGGSSGSRGSAGTPNSVSNKGGSGSFNSPPPYSYTNTRSTYRNYPPAYTSGYSPAYRYGYYGVYNPALPYFFIMPPFLYMGYHTAYHRYNQQDGYYYAPRLTEQGSNTPNVVINGTAFTGKDDENYHISFNISTNNQFPMVDHAFFATSDTSAPTADFTYRLQFSHVIEFDDLNQNGFYDSNEPILSSSSLRNLQWQPLMVSNITVPTNSSQFYLQTSTFANATYNNNNGAQFSVRITWRASNLQLNNTAPIVMQPNSLEYDFALNGFPANRSSPTARVAVAQLLSTHIDEPVVFDINTTTPVNIAQQIKTNITYGISIGNNTEGRLEYQNTVNLTDVTGLISNLNAQDLAGIPQYQPNDWIWGPNAPASNRTNKLVLVTMPTVNMSFSGFGFLDTDVMNALASRADVVKPMISLAFASVLATLFFIY